MKKITLLIFILISTICFSQTYQTWRSENADDNNSSWQDSDAWWNFPNPSPIVFGQQEWDNNVELAQQNNSNIITWRFLFKAGANQTHTFTGNQISFFDFSTQNPKIENLSSALHIINNNIIGDDTVGETDPLELNPVNGGLTFNGTINNNGNHIYVYGNNAKQLTINGVISGSGRFDIKQNSIVLLTADNTYSGFTLVEAGTLKLQGSIENSDVYVYNGAILEIDGDVSLKSLLVYDGGTVTVNPSKSLTILNNLTTLEGDIPNLQLNSSSTSYSSLIVEGTSFFGPNVTYNRYVNEVGTTAGGGNDLVSPPVTGQSWSEFLTANGPGGNESLAGNGTPYNTSTIYAFGPYVKSTNSFQNYTSTEAPDPPITNGQGYRAATTSGSTLSFKGGVVSSQTASINNTDSKWNLIGNPFPSYLKADAFLTANLSLLDSQAAFIYGYNGSSTGNKYQLIAPDSGYLIAPGQGFFVASNATGGSVQFNANMRSIAGGDDFISGRSINTENEVILKISNTSNHYLTEVNFREASTLGIDPGYDGVVFGDVAPEFSIYSHLLEENTGRDLAIQSLPLSVINDIAVPIGVNANQGVQFTISIDTSSLPVDVNVYLEDTLDNTFTLLNSSDYIITPTTTLNGTGRYFLRFTDTTLSNTDFNSSSLLIYANSTSKTIEVKGELFYNTQLYVYDIHGRMVLQQELDANTSSNSVTTNSLHTGVYIVQLKNESQYKTQKLIIE